MNTFTYFPQRPQNLTEGFVRQEYDRLKSLLQAAEESDDPGQFLGVYEDWNELNYYLWGEGARRQFRVSQDVRDQPASDAFRYARQQVFPAAQEGELAIGQAVLKSRHSAALENRYGTRLLHKMQIMEKPLAPVNEGLRVQEGDLVQEYMELTGTAEVMLNGKAVTLESAAGNLLSPDPALRRTAYDAGSNWYQEHGEQLGTLYDSLVQLRHKMGTNLGYQNFTPLGYLAMQRTDYGPEQVAGLCANVLKYAVPLLHHADQMQARALGADTLRPWDAAYNPAYTLPMGIAPVATQLDAAQRMFNRMSSKLGGHFQKMCREGLIDLENRPGKGPGAFCTVMPDEGRVMILCNSVGNQDDVSTLIHEMGHAFQGWESMHIRPGELRSPTADAAEIHSMGMEYLSLPYVGEFFDEKTTQRFRTLRWYQGIGSLCRLCMYDDFQHRVYEHPEWTVSQREDAFGGIREQYRPGIDYSGMADHSRTSWYRVPHYFFSPFYMIDYVVAETAAMQLALIARDRPVHAMDIYMHLCSLGGTMGVLDMISQADLRSPFDESLMHDLMEHAAAEIGLGNRE